MKKITCFILACLLIFSVCGCDESKGEKESGGTIDRYATQGVIPELPIALGTSIEEFKTQFPDAYEGADESKILLDIQEGNTAVCLVTLDASYYYEKANIDKGISVIAVTSGNVFGLEIGNVTTKSDITALLEAEYTEASAAADRLYFFPGYIEGCKVLTAAFDNYRLDFFMYEDYLIAATLTDTDNWTD